MNTPSERNTASYPIALYDRWLLLAIISLLTIGLLMVASASINVAERFHQGHFYYLFRQIMFLGLGLMLSVLALRLDSKTLFKLSPYCMIAALFFLGVVFVPGIGRMVNGSTRWLDLGIIRLQVSELVKLGTVIYLAGYLVRYQAVIRQEYWAFLRPLGLIGLIDVLLLLQPDFGSASVILTTSLGMLFLAGVRLAPFAVIVSGALSAFAFLAISAPYRLHRLTSFLNPWDQPYSSGYQLTQSLIAFGRGGWCGVGLGESVQKLFYLPEAHTDFLLAVLAEELGLVAVTAVILLFVLLAGRGFLIAKNAFAQDNAFGGFLAFGCSLWLSLQVIINIGVNVGVLPTKGLTLPLLSYGGSSLLANCLLLAFLLRIDHENRLQQYCLQASSWW
jgi:cell division protein FtsW